MKLKLIVTTILFMIGTCSAADWPQWRGVNRDGKSPDTGLFQSWPEQGPTLAWRIGDLGGGDSAPAIANGCIYLMSIRDNDEVVLALSGKDGSELWAMPLGPAFEQRPPQSKEGPSCTPTIDGDRLYVEGMGGNVACLQAEDGKIVWQISMTEKFGGRLPMWSFRESPLVDGDQVICTPGGENVTMVALNKFTGETIWQCHLPDAPAEAAEAPGRPGGRRGGFGRGGGSGAGYASPIVINFEGQRQYIQVTAKSVMGVAASDGKFLWRFDKPANRMGLNCTTAIYQDGMVFATSAYGSGCGLVKLSKGADDTTQAQEIYANTDMQNHHGGMILVDGCLYGATGGNEGGALMCMDFQTGKVLWDQRPAAGRRAKGSLALADGRLYYRMEDGTMLLIEPNRDKYIECGRFEQPDRRNPPAWAHPVVANGKLYIRDQDILFCYDVKAK